MVNRAGVHTAHPLLRTCYLALVQLCSHKAEMTRKQHRASSDFLVCSGVCDVEANVNVADERDGHAGRSGRFMKVCASSLSAECHAYLKYLSHPRQ